MNLSLSENITYSNNGNLSELCDLNRNGPKSFCHLQAEFRLCVCVCMRESESERERARVREREQKERRERAFIVYVPFL